MFRFFDSPLRALRTSQLFPRRVNLSHFCSLWNSKVGLRFCNLFTEISCNVLLLGNVLAIVASLKI